MKEPTICQRHIILYTRKKGRSSHSSRRDDATGMRSDTHTHNLKKYIAMGMQSFSFRIYSSMFLHQTPA